MPAPHLLAERGMAHSQLPRPYNVHVHPMSMTIETVPTASERLPVLVTKEQKARIAEKARAANLTMGELVRRAVDAYEPTEDEQQA